MPKTCEQEIPRNCCNILDLLPLSLRKENKARGNECSLSLRLCAKTDGSLSLIMVANFQDSHQKFLEDEMNTRMPLPWSQRLPCYCTLPHRGCISESYIADVYIKIHSSGRITVRM